MVSINRWQYPYIALAVAAFGLTIAGYYFAGISIASVYPAVIGVGLLIIVAHPTLSGYVMSGFGVLSLITAGMLTIGDASFIVQGTLIVIGIGALVGGIRFEKRRTNNQLK
ncbi:hypothetical protein [Halostagnicola kamekurae]|uniref:hypothetical protein n=1 Tax=Halostagnicola kamekurae TaxID=619731 RepID=UPI001113568B|nr:hypothetical protein [Halostagnicola kamekurae]